MKCERCSKPATIHITEIIDGSFLELHLCEDHAKQQLSSESELDTGSSVGAKTIKKFSKMEGDADHLSCPICGLTFREFRSGGRLGCPNDYEAFASELIPLLENIHSETQHGGKVPKRAPADSKRHTRLIQLRQSLRKAVASESYEEAAELRDQIREIEEDAKRSEAE